MTQQLSHPDAAAHLVPAGFAEKAMASLMQLHSELMDEKERRVDLFRRLMEREQALAELKMYVKLLETERSKAPETPRPPAQPSPVTRADADEKPSPPRPQPMPPRPVSVSVARPRLDGWKVW